MIAILLSTYNGEKYLEMQLESLLRQNGVSFKIYIRDDGSSDNTLLIIEEFKAKFPDKIVIIESEKNVGIRESFEILMQKASHEDYFTFCDQDDYWESNKIEELYKEILKIESENAIGTPLMLFSDMQVIDSSKNIIYFSYYKHIKLKRKEIERGLFKGVVSGCLMFFNKSALSTYFEQRRHLLHDHNMFMSVYLKGKIHFVDKILVKHIIHGNNYYGLGVKSPLYISFLDLIKYFFNNTDYRNIVLKEYFEYVDVVANEKNMKLRILKQLYTQYEVNKLDYLSRKFWFARHFKLTGIKGVIDLILV